MQVNTRRNICHRIQYQGTTHALDRTVLIEERRWCAIYPVGCCVALVPLIISDGTILSLVDTVLSHAETRFVVGFIWSDLNVAECVLI